MKIQILSAKSIQAGTIAENLFGLFTVVPPPFSSFFGTEHY